MSKICPSCNKTFDDSIINCPNCQIALVPGGQDNSNIGNETKQVSVFSLTSEASASRVIDYMKEQGVLAEYRYSLREKTFKIFVAEKDAKKALRACTSFYAVEAKRLKAEEDKIREAEEAKRRAEEEEQRRIEEEQRRIEEEQQRLREEEEARRRAEEEETIRKAEEETRIKAEEAERIRLEAEEAVRKAEEAARQFEEDAKLAAQEEERLKLEAEENEKRKVEEEKERQILEEQRRKEEEKEKKRAESERRRSLFAKGIRDAEAEKFEEKKRKFHNIPHVEGETVEEEISASNEENFEPENGPIFVETEPVEEYEVGDTITVDAVEIDMSEALDDAEVFYDQPAEQSSDFSGFFAGVGKRKNKISPSIFSPTSDEDKENNDSDNSTSGSQDPLVEEMFTDNVFTSTDSLEQSTKSFGGKDIYEEIINDELKSNKSNDSSAAPSKFAEKFGSIDSIDDGTYKGFVPDYHTESDEDEDEDVKIAKSYGFDPAEYKKLRESTAKKAQDRKNNPPPRKRPENKDFILMEEAPADEYRGFVPDYSQRKEQENMDYYTNRTTIDYSKYRTNSGGNDRNALTELNATLRSTSKTELSRLFENDVIRTATKPQDFIALKSSNYLLALTGGQLNSLFTAWLMTNCTTATVKQYVVESATPDENYKNKIEGIKNLLKQNFGKLDDAAIDIIVRKFYNKFLDE